MGKPVPHNSGSVAQHYDGPWMSADVLAALPQLKRDYQREADPEREEMRLHLQKPEAQRRQESVQHEAQLKSQAPRHPDKPAHGERDQTEQGSGEQSSGERSEGRGSAMVGKDQPKPALRPPERIARPVNETTFKTAWLAEQRDAAMAQARSYQPDHTHERQMNEPER